MLFMRPRGCKGLRACLGLPSLRLYRVSTILGRGNCDGGLISYFVSKHSVRRLSGVLPVRSPQVILVCYSRCGRVGTLRATCCLTRECPGTLVKVLKVVIAFVPRCLLGECPFVSFILLKGTSCMVGSVLRQSGGLSYYRSVGGIYCGYNKGVVGGKVGCGCSLGSLPASGQRLCSLGGCRFRDPRTVIESDENYPDRYTFYGGATCSPLVIRSVGGFFSRVSVLVGGKFGRFFFTSSAFTFACCHLLRFYSCCHGRGCSFE